MKKIFIILVVVIFVAYCFASARNYAYIPVPQYRDVTINIMKGMTQVGWENNPTAQKERFRELERKFYQPPVAGWHFQSGLSYKPDHVLTADDFKKILEQEPGLARDLQVRDPVALESIVAQGYMLRDNIMAAGGSSSDNQYVAKAGADLNKVVLDKLLSMGITEIRVTGKGNMVSPELGTMIMIVLIFLGLLSALDIVLFKPLVSMVDKRNAEIDAGMEKVRSNRVDASKLAQESDDKRKELRREHMSALAKARHEVMKEADEILHHANVEAHRIRDNAHLEMKTVIKEAEAQLHAEVDNIAREIVAGVLSAAGGKND